nr:hypothetical protein [Tanacetum cinerariifolium]
MYKSGFENKRANALSRMQGGVELAQIGVTTLTSDLYEEIKQGWTNASASAKHYTWIARQLLRKGKLVINNDEELRKKILFHFYNGINRGHSEISMDFIDGLPLSKRKTTIMVVVDRLSKATNFMALSHSYTAMQTSWITKGDSKPFAILDRRLVRKGNGVVVYVLAYWSNAKVADATWEPYDDIATRFPDFDMNV